MNVLIAEDQQLIRMAQAVVMARWGFGCDLGRGTGPRRWSGPGATSDAMTFGAMPRPTRWPIVRPSNCRDSSPAPRSLLEISPRTRGCCVPSFNMAPFLCV
jgi:hypothetical protein